MNQRLQELYLDAAKHMEMVQQQGLPAPYQTRALAGKFAELIIRECLEACSRANEIRHFVPPTQEQVVLSCMREIEQHFGVEL